MTGQLRRLNPDSPREGHAGFVSAAHLARLSALRVWFALLFLVLLAGSLRSENAGAKRYVIDVWQGEKGLPQNTITGIAQTSDGYLWITTLDGVARFDGVRFRMFRAGDTPALGSGRIRFLLTGRQGELWLATQEGGLIRLEDGHFTPLALPESRGVRSAIVQVARDDSDALWLSTEDGKVGRLAKDHYSVISTNWSAADQTNFQVRADFRNRLWALSSSGLCQLAGERLIPVLHGQPGEYVVHCGSGSGGWWLSAGGQVRLWQEGQWVARVGNPGVAAESITCGIEDRSGHLWLGTVGDGLFRCDTNDAPTQFTKRDGLSSNSVRTLFEDAEGNVWVGTEDGGLNRLRLPLFTVYGSAQGLSSERITTVSEGRSGEIWIGTDGYGLNRLQGGTARLATEETNAASWRVSAVLTDRQGQVWVALRSGGVFRWQDGTVTPLAGWATAGHPTRSLFEDSHGAVWIGQRNTRILPRVHGDKVSTIDIPQSMPLADVRVMAEDEAGNMWFGTDGAGLLRWRDGQFARFTRENGLSSDFVWALRPELDGALWIGTYGGGLTRLKDGHAVTCTTRHGLVDDVICHIADDGRGQYWLSSNQGIFRVGKAELNQFADGRQPRIQCVAYGRSDGLPALECEGGCQPAGCRTRDGRLWFPTIRGLVVVDPADVSTNTAAPPVHIEKIIVDGKTTEAGDWQRKQAARMPASLGSLQSSPRSSHTGLEVGPDARRLEFHYTGLNFSAPENLRFRHRLEGVDAEWVDTGGQREASYNQLAHGTYTFRVQACNREGVWNQAGDKLTVTVLPHFWETGWFIGLFLAAFGGTVGWTVRYALRRRHQRQLERVEHLHALERERTRIARDIHDDLGGSLTEIGYLGALAVRDCQSLEGAREQLTRITERTRELARRLDETVWAVNPKNDSPGQLATYLCHFAREFLEPTAIHCRLDISNNLPEVTLTAEVRHNVFLVVKEALNNAAKHSEAAELWLRLTTSGGVLIIEVSDNGRGFSVDAKRETGNGLRNMGARMEDIGGELAVRSAPGKGTTLCLRLPLPGNKSSESSPRGQPISLGDAAGGQNA
jgi:ligand-binding sensor domain-containing protein/signal transduction histidine kinase